HPGLLVSYTRCSGTISSRQGPRDIRWGAVMMEVTMTKTPERADRLIPFIRVGRLKRALPRLIEKQLAGGAEVGTATPFDMRIPECGREYFGLGRQKSYEVAYEVATEN